MPIQVDQVFSQGGRALVDLLIHSVLSINTDVLFLYLVREYRFRPDTPSAIALYDVFCHPQSRARISETSLLAPKDLRLSQSVESLRRALEAARQVPHVAETSLSEATGSDVTGDHEADTAESSPVAPVIPLPPRYLFDAVADSLLRSPNSGVHKLQTYYDAQKTPTENLPGGEMTASQRLFVDNVWAPSVRPYLVSAGFWRISTIG